MLLLYQSIQYKQWNNGFHAPVKPVYCRSCDHGRWQCRFGISMLLMGLSSRTIIDELAMEST